MKHLWFRDLKPGQKNRAGGAYWCGPDRAHLEKYGVVLLDEKSKVISSSCLVLNYIRFEPLCANLLFCPLSLEMKVGALQSILFDFLNCRNHLEIACDWLEEQDDNLHCVFIRRIINAFSNNTTLFFCNPPRCDLWRNYCIGWLQKHCQKSL